MRPQRKLNLDWQDPAARRRYHRDWTRLQRQAEREEDAEDPGGLLSAAFERARQTHAALPRDPVLDAWRVQKVVRMAFDASSITRSLKGLH